MTEITHLIHHIAFSLCEHFGGNIRTCSAQQRLVRFKVREGTFGLPSKYKTKSFASDAVNVPPVFISLLKVTLASDEPSKPLSVPRVTPRSASALVNFSANRCRVPVSDRADKQFLTVELIRAVTLHRQLQCIGQRKHTISLPRKSIEDYRRTIHVNGLRVANFASIGADEPSTSS